MRNRRDGSVEAVFAGQRNDVEAVIEACRRGPFSAHVSELVQREGTEADLLEGAAGGFSVRPTG
ncbi:MAG TPA: acylphosphatase [Pseudolabrys sp.]|nr:acylphosphatase [Pseudolabrys sp.]